MRSLKRLVFWLFPFIDRLAIRFLNLKPLRQDKISPISIRIKPHRGHCVKLENNTEIKPGDLVIELHFNNIWFAQQKKIASSFISPIWAITALADDLRYLATQLIAGKFSPKIKALCAVTIFHKAAPRFGFMVMELPSRFWKSLTQFYLHTLRQVYYGGRKERFFSKAASLEPKEIWISRVKFIEKYGQKGQ